MRRLVLTGLLGVGCSAEPCEKSADGCAGDHDSSGGDSGGDSSTADSGPRDVEVDWDAHAASIAEQVSTTGLCPEDVPTIELVDGSAWVPGTSVVIEGPNWTGVWRGVYPEGVLHSAVVISLDEDGWMTSCPDSWVTAHSELINAGYEVAEIIVYEDVIDVPGFAEGNPAFPGDHGWLCLDTLVLPERRGPGRAHGSLLILDQAADTLLFFTFEAADCIDAEDASEPYWCDGLDNDLDGETDEGGVDSDGDGDVDCPPGP